MRFPTTEMRKDCQNGMPRTQPRGIAPRSSIIGIIEQRKTASCGGKVSEKNVLIASAKLPTPKRMSVDSGFFKYRRNGLEKKSRYDGVYTEFYEVKGDYREGKQLYDRRKRQTGVNRGYKAVHRYHDNRRGYRGDRKAENSGADRAPAPVNETADESGGSR